MVGRLNSANALMGTSFELNSIAAVVLGGTSISGGSGSITGTVIGIITMGILSNGLDLLAVTAFWQKVVLGIVIILVVTLDTFRRERLSG
jgi:ribose/xylose/arabinose/galactoside ABC-type transport system permease subunit